jgi:hypothetical protein
MNGRTKLPDLLCTTQYFPASALVPVVIPSITFNEVFDPVT